MIKDNRQKTKSLNPKSPDIKQGIGQSIKRQIKITYDNIIAYFFSDRVDLTNEEEDCIVHFRHQEHMVGHLMGYVRSSLRFALYVMLFGVLFFGVWSGLAPLDSSTVAQGMVILSHRKDEIKHLEGGVVKEILVQEGEQVHKGQSLLVLDDVRAKAQVETIRVKLYTERAGEARLTSERDRVPEIHFPSHILNASETDEEVAKAVKVQEKIFEHGRRLVLSQLDTLDKQVVQVKELVKALKSQSASYIKQQDLFKQELSYKKKLFDQGLLDKERFIASQSQLERVSSEYSRLLGEIAAKEAEILGLQVRKISVEQEHDERIAKELKDVRLQIAELQERYNDAKQILNRTVVSSPSEGAVTDLKVNTLDGVISPGQHLMYIVPKNDHLVLEVMVNPNDIDSVSVGQKAKVQLLAYKARLVPRIEGVVTYISADVVEQNLGQNIPSSYYIARIEISQDALDELTENVRLQPGMQAIVFIVTGERTFLQYLISPITDSFHRAFIER